MSSSAYLAQLAFRFRSDTAAVEATPTWLAAEGGVAEIPVETPFRLRIGVLNHAGSTAASTNPMVLRVAKNNGTYTAVTTSSTLGVQSSTAASTDADEAAIDTARLSMYAWTWNQGSYDENGSVARTLAANQQKTEHEFGLILKTANLAAGDVLEFKLYNNTTAFAGYVAGGNYPYVAIPTICRPEAAGTYFAADKYLGGAGLYSGGGAASITMTVGAAAPAGRLVVITARCVTQDQTGLDKESSTMSITDSAGNTWWKARESLRSNVGSFGGAGAVAIWWSRLTNALNVGDTITASYTQFHVGGRGLSLTARSWTVPSGRVVAVAGSSAQAFQTAQALTAQDAATPNVECLRVRALAIDTAGSNASDDFATGRLKPTGWAAFNPFHLSGNNSPLGVAFSKISTTTTDPCDPNEGAATTYYCSVYVAFTTELQGGAATATASLSTPTMAIIPPRFVLRGGFSDTGVSGGGYNAAGQSSISGYVLSGAQAVGDLAVLIYACDNNATTDQDEGAVSSITDTGGNTWVKAVEWTKSGAAVQGGAVSGIWWSRLTSTLPGGNQITINFTNPTSRDAAVVRGAFFDVGGANTKIEVAGTNKAVGTAATLPSLDVVTPLVECLRIRAWALEDDVASDPSQMHSPDWRAGTYYAPQGGGTSANSITMGFEYRVDTTTGFASAPSALTGGAADHCSTCVAFTVTLQNLLANDISSASSVTSPGVYFPPDTEDNLLANDVKSNSTVTNPAVQQRHSLIVGTHPKSNSTVSQPAMVMRRDLLANDVKSNSSVSVPAATIRANHAALANDVISTSAVTQPTQLRQLHNALANDVSSASTVFKPTTLRQLQNLLANDISSAPKVSNPTVVATVTVACLANDLISASSVTQPVAVIRRDLLANDLLCASLVTTPFATIRKDFLANDVASVSSLTVPTAATIYTPLANDIISTSNVSVPQASVVGILAPRDIGSTSSVSTPAVHQSHNTLANDNVAPTSVTVPTAAVFSVLLANDNLSPSSVTSPTVHQLHGTLAQSLVAAAHVDQPFSFIKYGLLANDILSFTDVTVATGHALHNANANDIHSDSSVTANILGYLRDYFAEDIVAASATSAATMTRETVPPIERTVSVAAEQRYVEVIAASRTRVAA